MSFKEITINSFNYFEFIFTRKYHFILFSPNIYQYIYEKSHKMNHILEHSHITA